MDQKKKLLFYDGVNFLSKMGSITFVKHNLGNLHRIVLL